VTIPDPSRDVLREALVDALQETDVHRGLDSLEMVVVMTELTRFGIAAPADAVERPETIEGWVQWAGRCSHVS
jgi:aryl carrier-like protein